MQDIVYMKRVASSNTSLSISLDKVQSHEFSAFKEHIVLCNILKVSMEISKCKRHLLLFKKFS